MTETETATFRFVAWKSINDEFGGEYVADIYEVSLKPSKRDPSVPTGSKTWRETILKKHPGARLVVERVGA